MITVQAEDNLNPELVIRYHVINFLQKYDSFNLGK